MSASAVGWVFKHSPYSGDRRVIHLALADVANDVHDNQLWLKRAEVARKANTSDSTVVRALRQMVADGYLELIEPGGGRGNPPTYRMLFPKGGQPDTVLPERVSTGTDKGCQPVQPDLLSTQIELNTENSPAASLLACAFDSFWTTYPRKAGKAAARKAFLKAAKLAPSVDDILVGADRFARDPNREAEFTPHPATWLNQGRWEDEPLPQRNGKHPPSVLPAGGIKALPWDPNADYAR